jgi:diguanylate cyclase (GGDEF)-like protein
MLHGDDRPAALEAWRRCVQRGEPYETRLRLGRADGAWRWALVRARPERDEAGHIARWFGTCTDIHRQVMAEEKARWAANHDSLTRLPNRLLLQERLDEEIGRAGACGGGAGFALLLLDVDHFKRLNDTIGHDAGDRLLETFAARLREAVGGGGTVARLGGDEFAVILDGVTDEPALDRAVAAILAALREPCVIGGRMVDCQASIGAALFPRDGAGRVELMKSADVALYAAKRAGRATCRAYRPEMRDVSFLNLWTMPLGLDPPETTYLTIQS